MLGFFYLYRTLIMSLCVPQKAVETGNALRRNIMKATESNYHLLDDDVQSIVDSVLTKVSDRNDKFSIDPITIIAIINCVIGVVRLLYVCLNRSDSTLRGLRDPNFIQRFLIKRQIRKHADKEHASDIYDSIREHAHQMNEDDIMRLVNLYDSQQIFKEQK